MKQDVLVLGAGGHAKVVIDVLRACGHRVVAVFDDDSAKHKMMFHGVRVEGASADLERFAIAHELVQFIVAIGHNATRMQHAIHLQAVGLQALSAVHPSAIVAESVKLGVGSVIMPGVCLNADTVIGDHVIVNTGACIDHDCVIDAGVHIGPGVNLCGGVRVGVLAQLGVGASVTPGVSVGCRAVVGAGAAVIRDVANDLCVIGVPARPMGDQQ